MKNHDTKVLKVCVTKDDIIQGRPGNPNFCPIAIALRRTTGGRNVDVCEDVASYDDTSKQNWGTALTKKAQRFIDTIDNKGQGAVKPQCFRFVFKRYDWRSTWKQKT